MVVNTLDDFTVITITLPGEVPQEAQRIMHLLSAGVKYVHIRKPGWSTAEVKRLIEDIHISLRCRLRLHGHFELLNEFNLAGVQLNSRCPVAPATARTVTRSCHTLEELSDAEQYEYVTLSPIYDSISKEGYKAKWRLEDLRGKITAPNVIALGGVTPEKFDELRAAGFSGAALSGYLFPLP